jgi:Reverse transcriptase (RNA-dependent DNA polymerase)
MGFCMKNGWQILTHMCCKRFSQVPGKAFQENHAPVIADTTLHLLLVIKTIMKLHAGQFDIETVSLYGKLEEELWMEVPDGYTKYLLENTIKQLAQKHIVLNGKEK